MNLKSKRFRLLYTIVQYRAIHGSPERSSYGLVNYLHKVGRMLGARAMREGGFAPNIDRKDFQNSASVLRFCVLKSRANIGPDLFVNCKNEASYNLRLKGS